MIKVYNPQSTPLIYGNGKTIGGCEWAEGTTEEFQELLDAKLVKVVGTKTEPKTVESKPAEEVQETLVVSTDSDEETGDTMKRIKKRSVTTKE
jgi:hypothetical protein